MCLVHETHSWDENAALFQRSCYCVKHCKSTLKTHFSLIHSFPIHFVYIIFASENMHRIESNVCDMCVGMATSMGVRQQKQSITRLFKRWYGFKMYTKTILPIQNTRHSERVRESESALMPVERAKRLKLQTSDDENRKVWIFMWIALAKKRRNEVQKLHMYTLRVFGKERERCEPNRVYSMNVARRIFQGQQVVRYMTECVYFQCVWCRLTK